MYLPTLNSSRFRLLGMGSRELSLFVQPLLSFLSIRTYVQKGYVFKVTQKTETCQISLNFITKDIHRANLWIDSSSRASYSLTSFCSSNATLSLPSIFLSVAKPSIARRSIFLEELLCLL